MFYIKYYRTLCSPTSPHPIDIYSTLGVSLLCPLSPTSQLLIFTCSSCGFLGLFNSIDILGRLEI